MECLEDRSVPAAVTFAAAPTLEGNTGQRELVINVNLSQPEAEEVILFYASADDTAVAGVDYGQLGNLLTFAPGDTSKSIIVQINGDTDVEPDEKFTVKFQRNAGPVTLADDTVICTIVNDDAVPPPPPPAPPANPPQQPQAPNPPAPRTNTTFADATALAPPDARLESTPVTQWQNVPGITSKAEPAFYKIQMGVPFGLAVDLKKAPGAPGVTLELFDGNQNRIFTTLDLANGTIFDPYSFGSEESAPTSAGFYCDLLAGTYYVKASVTFGTADFTLKFLTDTLYSAAVPEFDSLPGAPVSLMIDFDGHSSNSPTDYWISQGKTPSYSFKAINIRGTGHVGNPNTFSPGERLFMANTWRTVAEDYSPLNINVTTRNVPLVQNGVPLGSRAVVINKEEKPAWLTGGSGQSPLNGFSLFPGEGPSFSYAATILPGGFLGQNASVLKGVGDTVSHESAHNFGLNHQFGIKTNLPNTIPGGPTLGIGLDGVTSGGSKFLSNDFSTTWITGLATPDKGPDIPQTDLDMLARLENRAGYRPDEAGSTTATATALVGVGSTYTRSAVIAKSDDVDIFSFTASGRTTIDVEVGSRVSDPGLITLIELFDSNGASVAQGEKTTGDRYYQSIAGTLTTRVSNEEAQVTLAAGHGFVVGETINLVWATGKEVKRRDGMKVTAVAGDVVTVDGGYRDLLPGANAPIVAAKALPSGRSSITKDLTAGTYFLKITGFGRRPTDTPNTFIENVGRYDINIRTAAQAPGQPVNQAPVVMLPRGNIVFKSMSPAVTIDDAATVKDDSPDFNGGTMTVSLTGGNPLDALAIAFDNTVTLAGAELSVNGNVIGTLTIGDPQTPANPQGFPLVIEFTTDDATPAAVQDVLRRITFVSTADVANLGAARTLSVVVKDRQGLNSTAVTKTISVIAPDRGGIKLVNNLGLTVTTTAPGLFSANDLKVTTPDTALGPVTIEYTVTQVPKNGILLLGLPTDDATSPNFLPIQLHVGDTFTQAHIAEERLAYRLTPGSTATEDQWSFTATDHMTGALPDTVVKIRVGQAPAPQQGNPIAPIGIQECFSEPESIQPSADLKVTITDVAIDTTIGANRLSYVADDPRDLVYEILSGPAYGSLNLTTFTQKTIDDNGLTYTSPLVANVPPGVKQDSFIYIVRDTSTGGVTEAVTFLIDFEDLNDAPKFVAGTNTVTIGAILPIGPRDSVARVQDILIGAFYDPDFVPGVPSGFGLAITGFDDTHGSWEYSTDDRATWLPIPDTVSETNAFLLSGFYTTTLIRFVADGDYTGSAEFSFKLWDETEGGSGQFANPFDTETGAYSLASGRVVVESAAAGTPPSFTGGEEVTINEDAGPISIAGWATDIVGDNLGPVTFLVESEDYDPNDLPFTQFPSIDPFGKLTFEVAAGASGTAEFEVLIPSLAGDSATAVLTITVNAVNDYPTIVIGPSLQIGAGAGLVVIPGWASGISAGPGETDQTLEVSVIASNPGIFAVQPTLDLETGELRFTTKVGTSGTSTVSISLSDDGGTANGGVASTNRAFTITTTRAGESEAAHSQAALAVAASFADSANVVWIQELYRDILNREADDEGLTAWSSAMAAGATRVQIAAAILRSYEYAAIQVTELYQSLLGRTPDADGLTALTSLAIADGSLKNVKANMLASDEYLAKIGAKTDAEFVNAVFQDVFRRDADPDALAVFRGIDRATIARLIVGSLEADQRFVATAFQGLLGRSAGAEEQATFASLLQSGSPEHDVLAIILGSDEYFAAV